MQLHMAMPIEHGGKRFTLLWYSVATRWLKKLSDSDLEELTQSGYSHSFCVAGSYMNDSRSYEDGLVKPEKNAELPQG